MPRRILFVGPSLPDAVELTHQTDIEVLPPVAAGDLLRLSLSAGDVIGIIDGYFHQVGAVRHKEILALLDQGVRVLGASSMGALRAAELDRFGMEGIGSVYADYRDGRLEADDEVTLMHSTAEEGYVPLSEPLVCVRATLSKAVVEGACDAATASGLVEILARRPFGLRSFDALVSVGEQAGKDPQEMRRLRSYCIGNRVDPKREDALLLLDALLSAGPPGGRAGSTVPVVHRTSFLYAWQIAALGSIGATTGRGSDLGVLRACQLFAQDYPRFHRQLILGAIVRECAEACGLRTDRMNETDLRVAAVAHGEHRGFYALPADPLRLGFLTAWLTRAELDELSPDDQLVTFLVRSFRVTPGMMWDEIAMDALRGSKVWDDARHLVRMAWHLNDRVTGSAPDRSLSGLSQQRILSHFARHWDTEQDELGMAAMDRGIDPSGVAAVGRAFYVLARYNPDAVNLVIGDTSSP
jgi:hypothetical protein